jgi:hypothetical protein
VKVFYSTKQLAAAFPAAFSESSLKKSRMSNAVVFGPPWKTTGTKVFYDLDEVLAWIDNLRPNQAGSALEIASPPPRKTGAGRPTKAVEIARRQHAA